MSSEGLDRIVAELQRGTNVEENFRRLFERFYGTIYRFFANRGFPADECVDLTQEAFLRVYSSIESYRGESPFEAWLFGILLRIYRKTMRWRHATKRSAQEVPLDASESGGMLVPESRAKTEDPEGNVLEREQVEILERAISDLPTQMRRALILRVHHGLTYREVAEILGLTVNTVKSHLHFGRRKLQEALRKSDGVVE